MNDFLTLICANKVNYVHKMYLFKLGLSSSSTVFIILMLCSTVKCIFFFSLRDELKRHYTLGEYWIEVEMEDLASFDEDLSDCLYKLPTENLPLVRTELQ